MWKFWSFVHRGRVEEGESFTTVNRNVFRWLSVVRVSKPSFIFPRIINLWKRGGNYRNLIIYYFIQRIQLGWHSSFAPLCCSASNFHFSFLGHVRIDIASPLFDFMSRWGIPPMYIILIFDGPSIFSRHEIFKLRSLGGRVGLIGEPNGSKVSYLPF